MAATPNFKRGAEQAKEASKSGGNFLRTEFFSLDDEESTILRFLTDGDMWITVDQHMFAKTKDKPAGRDSWPSMVSVICSDDEAFEGMFDEPCYTCLNVMDSYKKGKTHTATSRTWALAVEREEVREGATLVGFRDVEYEVVDKDGNKRMAKKVLFVNMAWQNFFSKVNATYAFHGTVLNRDFYVKREGTKKDTDYMVSPMDPVPVDEAGTIFDVRKPEHMERYVADMPDLGEEVMRRAIPPFHHFWFDPSYTGTADGKPKSESDGGEEDDAAQTSNDVSEETVKGLADRVKAYASTSPADEGDAPSEAPAPRAM